MRVIGFTLAESDIQKVLFVKKNDENVKVGDFCVIEHPLYHGGTKLVLMRVSNLKPINPEMTLGALGALAGSRGLELQAGTQLEYIVGECEVLGYVDSGRFMYLEAPPPTWTPVYKPDSYTLKQFFESYAPRSQARVPVGTISGVGATFWIDLDAIARGHAFVAGMTRSGKSVTPDTRVLVYTTSDRAARWVEVSELTPESELYTLSLSSNLSWRWSRVAGVLRHRAPLEGVEVETESGRRLRVTRDHSVIAVTAGGAIVTKASLLREGMMMISPRGEELPGHSGECSELYVGSLLDACRKALRVSLHKLAVQAELKLSEVKQACKEGICCRETLIKLTRALRSFLSRAGRGASLKKARRSLAVLEAVASEWITLDPVKRVVRARLPPLVYDIDVADGSTFLANSLFVHNSSFVMTLLRRSLTFLKYKPTLLVLDRRGEYTPLARYGGVTIPYDALASSRSLTPGDIARMLGYTSTRAKAAQVVMEAVERLQRRGDPVNSKAILSECRSLLSLTGGRRYLAEIAVRIEECKDVIDELACRDSAEVIELIRRFPLTIVDFSVDVDFTRQYMVVKELLRTLIDYAVEQRSTGGFALITVVEEAQYIAPERNAPMVSNPQATGVDKVFTEAVSQAGGYNLGFIVVTQRPAYVSKNVISQANSVFCFRMRSGADQDAIARYTEQGDSSLRRVLPGLADHQALAWGPAVPAPFPVLVDVDVDIYPAKAAAMPSEAWRRMEEQRKAAQVEEHHLEIEA